MPEDPKENLSFGKQILFLGEGKIRNRLMQMCKNQPA